MSNPIDLNQNALPHLGLDVSNPEGEAMKQSYLASFSKQLVDSTGHPFDVCQGVVEVRAISGKAAVDEAKWIAGLVPEASQISKHAQFGGAIRDLPGH
jgi:hypothetical protein